MTPQLLNEFRAYLKGYKAVLIDEKYVEHIDVLNGLIPAFVDAIQDEELEAMIDLMCDYIMDQILQPPAGESEEKEPLDNTTPSVNQSQGE